MKNITIITMTFATLLTTSMMSGNAAAAECYTKYITATSSSAGAIAKFRKRRAERRAKAKWENKVTRQYGGRYADFDNARGARVTFGTTSRGNTSATAKGTIVVCY